VGIALNVGLCIWWWDVHLGPLEIRVTMRYALWGSTLMILGMQTVYGSFFLGMLQMSHSAESWPTPPPVEGARA
jgi:hypothetical protein